MPKAPVTRVRRASRPTGKRSGKQKRSAVDPATLETMYVEPMKALGVTEVGPGNWRVEIKFDGYRALATILSGAVELWSRNRKTLSARFPEVAEALRKLACDDAVIDGEIVAIDEAGRSVFQLLQRLEQLPQRPPLLYYVFDLVRLNGTSLIREPLERRQTMLRKLVGSSAKGTVRLSPVFDLQPEELLARARQQGLEGIIAKAAGSPYEPGRRSGLWQKCRLRRDQEFVIGGFTPPKGSRSHFGSILVGYYEKDQLIYAGKVGSGFDQKLLASLHREFMRIHRTTCPFANLPMRRKPRFGQGMTAAAMREVTWIEPVLVAQIAFSEFTEEGILRQPVFLGLRDDKSAREVVRETASSTRAET